EGGQPTVALQPAQGGRHPRPQEQGDGRGGKSHHPAGAEGVLAQKARQSRQAHRGQQESHQPPPPRPPQPHPPPPGPTPPPPATTASTLPVGSRAYRATPRDRPTAQPGTVPGRFQRGNSSRQHSTILSSRWARTGPASRTRKAPPRVARNNP